MLRSMLLLWSFAAFGMSPADSVVGSWVLKSVYPTSNVQGPSSSERRRLIGSKIVIDDKRLRSCGQPVPIRSRVVHRLSAGQFLSGNHVRLSEVGIRQRTVTEIVLNDRGAGRCFGAFPVPGQLLYLKSKNELVVGFEGTFYRALRVD